MQVRMELELASPGVQDADHAQLRAEVARLRRDRLQRGGGLGEEQVIEQLRPRGERGPQRRGQVKVTRKYATGRSRSVCFCVHAAVPAPPQRGQARW